LWSDNITLIEQIEPATITTVVADDMPWQPDGITREDWSDEDVRTPKPALSRQQLHRGFAPPVPQRGLANILEDVNKNYLAHALGNSLLEKVLITECIETVRAYEAEQARIVSIPVMPAPSAILPPPGIAFSPSIPTACLGIIQRYGRGDPPMSVTGTLSQPVGRSTLRREEWYESCSLAEPEFLALVEEAKKLLHALHRREHHLVIRRVKVATDKAKKTAYFVIPEMTPTTDIAMVLKQWEHNPGVPTTI